MNKYHIKYLRGSDPHVAYNIMVDAPSPEIAVEQATEYLLRNAHWSPLMTEEEKRAQLHPFTITKVSN